MRLRVSRGSRARPSTLFRASAAPFSHILELDARMRFTPLLGNRTVRRPPIPAGLVTSLARKLDGAFRPNPVEPLVDAGGTAGQVALTSDESGGSAIGPGLARTS